MAENAQLRQQDIDKQIKKLNAKQPAERRTAALFLGEAAADTAVPKLVEIYRNDPDPRVRGAAAYALGQFRAIEEAIAEGDEDVVVELLDQVENRYTLGRRVNPMPTYRLVFGLLAALLALIVLNLTLPNGVLRGQIPGLTPPSLTRAEVIDALRPTASSIQNDAATLDTEFQNVLEGAAIDCQAYFNDPQPVSIAPENASAYGDLGGLAARINAQQAVLAASKQRYDGACFNGQPLRGAEVGMLLAPLVNLQTEMDTINGTLATLAEEAIPTLTPTEAPTAIVTEAPLAAVPADATADPLAAPLDSTSSTTAPPTETAFPTEIPTAAPSATPVDIRRDINALVTIIDSVQGQRGAAAQLQQNWQDAQQGRTENCRLLPPAIPLNYVLTSDAAESSTQLTQAAQLVNDALEGLRAGWRAFNAACSSSGLQAAAPAQVQLTAAIYQQLTSANEVLQGLVGQ